MYPDLKNKVVIVTGGFRGNGKAIVKNFLQNGSKVYSLDNKFIKSEKKNNLSKIKIDLTNFDDLDQLIKKIGNKNKKIDILINNAGITLDYKKYDLSSHWHKTLNINLHVPYFLINYCKKFLIKSKNPSIINISSISSKIAMSNNVSYNVSKSGLNALTMSIAHDFAKHKIRVNSICPGYIKTDMTKKSYSSKRLKKIRVQRTMTKNYGKPEDIANLAVFLSSTNSRYINAEELIIDGGLIKKGI
tara:strand:- start:11718 stop:12452 length:735 start_codon:yes stop_codon:yes gene_type:complete